MLQTCSHSHSHYHLTVGGTFSRPALISNQAPSPLKRRDPTGTTTLRASFVAEVRRRIRSIKRDVIESIVEDDVLGLKVDRSDGFRNASPGKQAFAFETSAEKHDLFMEWLEKQTDISLLQPEGWTDEWIESAYKKGVVDSFIEMKRGDLFTGKAAGFNGVTKEEFARQSFAMPVHRDALELIFTRVYKNLEGIDDAMDLSISQILANGLVEGRNPRELARQITKTIDTIGRNRATIMARTEVVRAHAEATLNNYESFGVYEVKVLAEWSTAGDDRVCPICLPMEGIVVPTKEARGLLPRHAQCRCSWVPALADEHETGQKRGAAQRENLFKRSVAREGGSAKSSWPGKEGLGEVGKRRAKQSTLDKELNRIRADRDEKPLPAGSATRGKPPVSQRDVGRGRKPARRAKTTKTKVTPPGRPAVGAPAPSSRRRAPGRRVPFRGPSGQLPQPGVGPTKKERLDQFRKENLNRSTERAQVVDARGNVVLSKDGGGSSVTFTDADRAKMRNRTLIHNHPPEQALGHKWSEGLSPSDVGFAVSNGAAEMRAVGVSGEGILRIPTELRGDAKLAGKVANEMESIHTKVAREQAAKAIDDMRRLKWTKAEANRIMQDRILRETNSQMAAVAKANGLGYAFRQYR